MHCSNQQQSAAASINKTNKKTTEKQILFNNCWTFLINKIVTCLVFIPVTCHILVQDSSGRFNYQPFADSSLDRNLYNRVTLADIKHDYVCILFSIFCLFLIKLHSINISILILVGTARQAPLSKKGIIVVYCVHTY